MKKFFTKQTVMKILQTTTLITILSAIFVVPKIGLNSNRAIEMRWHNIPLIFVIGLCVFTLYHYLLTRRASGIMIGSEQRIHDILHSSIFRTIVMVFSVFLLIFPLLFNVYHTKVMTLVFIYIIFSLGLNVVVGLTGMLCLGQAFFLGVGAYAYALFNVKLHVGFYSGLFIGGCAGILAGLIFALVTLRLRGDYLAIVTLGLSEIFRLVVTNLNFTGGSRGLSGIEKPSFFGVDLSFFTQTKILYFISFAIMIVSILLIRRLERSRLGRSWESLREDEIASSAMGINTSLVRMGVFSLNGLLGGIAGVLFAANTSFIDPNSFSILVSVTALCIVVLGGLGSISGVVLGAIILIMMPEYLRVFAQYRMLVFGFILVFMMLFRPMGIIPKVRAEFFLEEADHAKSK